MKNFKELKVYRIADSMYDGCQSSWDTVYTCRGMACNMMKGFRGCSIKEERILYTGEQPTSEDVLFRAFNAKGDGVTSWYLSCEAAEDAAKSLRFEQSDLQTGYLNTEQIEPLEKEFPVYFHLDDKGRPYARIDAHPEWEGFSRKGKVFFPDRSFVGADMGEAIVSISKEFDTYGFLTGKMVPYKMPDMKKFLDWAWEKKAPDTQVFFINHPGRGRYLAIETLPYENAPEKRPVRITETTYDWAPDQHIWEGSSYEETVERDAERYVERKCSLTQLYLEDAWGMDVDLDAILAKFDDTSSLWAVPAVWTPSLKFRGETIDTACKNGFLAPYCVEGRQVEALQVVPECLDMLSYFSYEEVCEMAAKVNEINAAAKEKLTGLLRKGKF